MPSSSMEARTMNHKAALRILGLAICVWSQMGCFSASSPKDLAALTEPAPDAGLVLVLDAALPSDPGLPSQPTDTWVPVPDVQPEDTASGVDIDFPDFSSPDDVENDALTDTDDGDSDAGSSDTSVDTFVPDANVPEDTSTADTGAADTGAEDTTTIDGPTPCEGINCPGSLAPTWALQDFQPQSPYFEDTYGLEKFEGKVTVMVLLAGW
jgi:hypothetical protein